MPRAFRGGLAAALTSISADRWSRLLAFAAGALRPAQIGDKIHKFASRARTCPMATPCIGGW